MHDDMCNIYIYIYIYIYYMMHDVHIMCDARDGFMMNTSFA